MCPLISMDFSHTNCGYIIRKVRLHLVWLDMALSGVCLRKNLNFLKIDLARPAITSDYTISYL